MNNLSKETEIICLGRFRRETSGEDDLDDDPAPTTRSLLPAKTDGQLLVRRFVATLETPTKLHLKHTKNNTRKKKLNNT